MVGSTYPGGGEATKGLAVRQLKSYVSWVQTVVRQVGLYLLRAFGIWGELALVREDRAEHTSGVPALVPTEMPGSYVWKG